MKYVFLLCLLETVFLAYEPEPVVPDTIPFINGADLIYKLEEEWRVETRKLVVFTPEGHWMVESDIDHDAHWKHQMDLLRGRCLVTPTASDLVGGAEMR